MAFSRPKSSWKPPFTFGNVQVCNVRTPVEGPDPHFDIMGFLVPHAPELFDNCGILRFARRLDSSNGSESTAGDSSEMN